MIVLAGFVTLQCLAQKSPKVTYEFPPQMLPAIQEQYLKLCEKGRVLYDLNCAKCHNTKVKGKTVIPDFSQEKLISYELRVANKEHEATMPETQLTAEELSMVTTFLTYKKKNTPAQ